MQPEWLTLLRRPANQRRLQDLVYSFSPLLLELGQIRLLQLQPAGQYTDDIECSLLRADLGSATNYEALSYTWGKTTDPGLIILNRCPFRITRNLFDALRDLRQTHEVRTLWIDALCINQADVTERSEQVQQMTAIYQQASRVLVWLGSEVSDPIRAAMRYFQDWPATRQFSLSGGRNVSFESTDLSNSPYMTDVQLQGLSEILRRPWFRRVWVVQEVAVAKSILIGCGPTTGSGSAWVTWATLADTNGHWMRAMLNNYEGDVVEFALCTTQLGCMQDLKQMILFGMDQRPSLWRLMRVGENFDSTDPVDKVFALLGMAGDRETLNLIPDYSRTPHDIYQDAPIAICTSSRSLDILTLGLGPKLQNLPTWVRDFSSCPEPIHMENGVVLPIIPLTDLLYAASGTTPPNFSVNRAAGQLIFEGKQLGRLAQVIPIELELLTYDTSATTDSHTSPEPKHTHLESDERRDALSPVHYHVQVRNFGKLFHTLEEAEACEPTNTSSADAERTLKTLWLILMAQRHILCDDVSLSDLDDSYTFGTWKDCRNPNDLLLALVHHDRFAHTRRFFQSQASLIAPVLRASIGRCFFTTETGHAGLCPVDARPGDLVVVPFGASVPLVLRRRQSDGACGLVGSCYVYGFMDGEIVDTPAPTERFTLH